MTGRRIRFASFLIALAATCVLVIGCSDDDSSPADAGAAAVVPLDQAWLIGTHNSYWVDRNAPMDFFASGVQENLLDQLLAEHVRAVELDVHPDQDEPHRYRVYHTVPGNSLCDDFADCLRPLRLLQYALPQHELVHVIIELKKFTASNFDADHSVEDFEAILESEIGPWMIRPRDILARCGVRDGDVERDILECLGQGGWPTLAEGRGRFIVSVLSNFDDLIPSKGTLDWATYTLHGSLHERSAFSMASSWKLDWDTLPEKIRQELSREQLSQARGRAAFLQVQDTADPNLLPFIERRGLVRIDGAFSVDDQSARVVLGAQILQGDSPWLQLDDRGPAQPVRLIEGMEEVIEPGDRIRLSAPTNGSTFGEAFAWRRAEARAASWLETVPSVGATSDAFACLAAARTSADAATSSYLLCRGKVRADRSHGVNGGSGDPDTEKIRLRVRICRAAECRWTLLPLDSVEEVATAIAVQFTADGESDCVQSFVASDFEQPDRLLWRAAGEPECFSDGLAAQGLAVVADLNSPTGRIFPQVTNRSALFVRTGIKINGGLRVLTEQELESNLHP